MNVPRSRIHNGAATADPTAVGTPLTEELSRALLTGNPLPFRLSNATAGTLRMEIHEATQEAVERMRLARAFTEAVSAVTDVREVWFAHDGHDTLVTVLTPEADLDSELRIEALFRSIFRIGGNASDALLDVFSESEGIPDSARRGERLR